MDSERWEKIGDLYHAASERPPAERDSFLDQACLGDAELRREVESLLRQDVSQDGVLERVSGGARLWSSAERRLPAHIGRYRIVRLVGEGGMGAVYEAEQDHPRRTVALKVVKSFLAVPEVLRRFEQESLALGRLQHPGIAQVYEAGVADTGLGPQPYFAMEFIHGLSLLDYVKAHQLNTRQRLELMAKVCDAVQHAHQRGVIHRDLKPGNILVDETGQPKILDFGVARITDSDAQVTRQTDLGELVGTLAYMSPEQVLADPSQLDARSDVYALGVVLYELLAGHMPYVVTRNVPEAARVIREEDPAPLRTVSRAYRGDLETMVGKALEKDKTRRYATAADLAADLRRFLTDQPIQAKPPSTGYQLRKFAARHKAVVATLTAVFIVLTLGILASTWQAVRANRAESLALQERDRATAAERRANDERDRALHAEQAATGERNRAEQERNHALAQTRRADSEAAASQAVNDFLQKDLLVQAGSRGQSSANAKPDPDLKVREALDRAAAGIAGKFDSQPSVEASIRQTIGDTYRDLGLFAEAQPHMERALELRQRALGPDNPDTLKSMNQLALLYINQGKFPPALALTNKVLETQRRLSLGDEQPETLAALNNLANIAGSGRGNHAEAEALYVRLLAVQRRVLGEGHPETLMLMNNLAAQYVDRGKYLQAEELYLKVIAAKRRVMGEEAQSTLTSTNSLAVVYRNQGKYAQAEALLRSVLDVERRTLGEQHPDTLGSMNSLALVKSAQAKHADAEALFMKSLDGRRKLLGPEHPLTLTVMFNLAETYRREGRLQEAEALFNQVLDIRRRVLGPDNPNTTNVLAALGAMKLEQREYSQAESLLRDAMRSHEKVNADTWRRYYTQSMLGQSLAGLGRHAEAEPLLVSGYEELAKRRESIPSENRSTLDEVRTWIGELYRDWGKPERAGAWSERVSKF